MDASTITIPIDAAWVTGYLLAMTRVAAFALASPLTGRSVPVPGRLAFAVAVATAMARPVPGMAEIGELIVAGLANAAVGLALGWVSGLILHMFVSAGGILDFVSGLSVATVFDPMMGDQGGVFGRMFHLTAVTLFVVTGGLGLLVTGLVVSTRFLPLDATLTLRPGLTATVVELVTLMVRSAVELALPILGVMLMLELALGLAARFAPQANVFLLGMPIKLFAAITVVGSAFVLFPDAMSSAQDTVARSLDAVMRGLGGAPPV